MFSAISLIWDSIVEPLGRFWDWLMKVLGPVFKVILWVASVLADLRQVINYTRASTLVVVFGVAFLLSAQGREITVGLADLRAHQTLFLYLGLAVWGFFAWYWARFMLDQRLAGGRMGQPDKFLVWLIEYWPRLLGGFAYLIAAVMVYLAEGFRLHFWVVGGIGIAFMVFVIRRKGSKIGLVQTINTHTHFWMLMLSIITVPTFLIATIFVPVQTGTFMGAGAVTFLAFAAMVPVGTFFVFWTQEKGTPVFAALFVFALLFSRINDTHEIRFLPDSQPADMEMTAAFELWQEAGGRGQNEVHPVVFVATAGGGIRAAYFTATVLGELEEAVPGMHCRMFAVSGVSGGSLGAVVHSSVLKAISPSCDGPAGPDFAAKSRQVLAQDFLGPTVAAMLGPDLIQAFLPVGIFDDRAEVLELSWERGYQRAFDGSDNLLAGPFGDIGPQPGAGNWRPVLLLNGTQEESGKRILTSHISVRPTDFPDAIDFFDLSKCDVRASTAALNSARFTYVSPAGTISGCGGDGTHVLDGGYFENYGAVSLLQAIRRFTELAKHQGIKIRPIIIQISNDTGFGLETYSDDRPRAEGGPQKWANEALAPIFGLLGARTARGILAAKELRQWLVAHNQGAERDQKGIYVHFRLYDEGVSIALGWLLSNAAEEEIERQYAEMNKCQRQMVTDALAATVTGIDPKLCSEAKAEGLVGY